MLGSKEDAEDVLQEVFANAYNAILADQREINVRPWLYRIARNRCLNHLRRPDRGRAATRWTSTWTRTAAPTADVVHRRADVRHLLEDVQKLPESQRTALLLREIDALSYDQIAEAMETTIPSVKSLLVRARMSLAEAAEARQLSCDDVRRELAEIAEGLKKASPALRRHVRECEECRDYRTQLRKTTTAMALAFPIGPLLILKKLALAKLGAARARGRRRRSGRGRRGGRRRGRGAAGATGAVTAATGAAPAWPAAPRPAAPRAASRGRRRRARRRRHQGGGRRRRHRDDRRRRGRGEARGAHRSLSRPAVSAARAGAPGTAAGQPDRRRVARAERPPS